VITFKEYIVEAKDPDSKIVSKLEAINKKLNAYAHRWGENPSQRMMNWVDEYNDLKSKHKTAWETYCKKNGLTTGHNAYDCLA